MSPLMPIMLFVMIMIVAVFLFTGWIVVMIGRALWRALAGNSAPPVTIRGAMDSRMCVREHCRAINPSQAKFCRRCGSAITSISQSRRSVAG
jgi:hypothetical protein